VLRRATSDQRRGRTRLLILAAAAVTLAVASACGSSQASARKPPVYILDPGLGTLAVRPEYISFGIMAQRFTWLRGLHWQSWGGETARGRGVYEACSGGRCKRTGVDVRLWRRRPRNCPTGSSYTRVTYVLHGRAVTRHADPYVCEND
jgi:hypothetical protein